MGQHPDTNRRDAPPGRAPVAFVLSSGANLGAVQIGMLRALIERHVYPDMIVGCSIGAINGAGLAADPTAAAVDRLDHIWRTTPVKELMGRSWLPPGLALMRRAEAIHTPDGLHHLLRRALTVATFEELETPLHCVATDITAGAEAWFDSGPLFDALLASAAMPAMFPTVEIDGRRYLDGAVVNDVPIRRAAELGARTLYILEVGPLTRPWTEPTRPIGMAIQAYWLARRHRYQRELDAVPRGICVRHMPHGEPPSLRVHDLSRSGELIDRAHEASAVYLDRLAAVGGEP